jgi:TetR/AcrR family transcriptional regulator
MLLFGMLNWTHTWYRPDGALAPEQLAALAGDLFLSGLDALAAGRRLAG